MKVSSYQDDDQVECTLQQNILMYKTSEELLFASYSYYQLHYNCQLINKGH